MISSPSGSSVPKSPLPEEIKLLAPDFSEKDRHIVLGLIKASIIVLLIFILVLLLSMIKGVKF